MEASLFIHLLPCMQFQKVFGIVGLEKCEKNALWFGDLPTAVGCPPAWLLGRTCPLPTHPWGRAHQHQKEACLERRHQLTRKRKEVRRWGQGDEAEASVLIHLFPLDTILQNSESYTKRSKTRFDLGIYQKQWGAHLHGLDDFHAALLQVLGRRHPWLGRRDGTITQPSPPQPPRSPLSPRVVSTMRRAEHGPEIRPKKGGFRDLQLGSPRWVGGISNGGL